MPQEPFLFLKILENRAKRVSVRSKIKMYNYIIIAVLLIIFFHLVKKKKSLSVLTMILTQKKINTTLLKCHKLSRPLFLLKVFIRQKANYNKELFSFKKKDNKTVIVLACELLGTIRAVWINHKGSFLHHLYL